MKIPNHAARGVKPFLSLARIVSEDSQHPEPHPEVADKSSKDI